MTQQTETAILAGGCFWGMEDLLRRMPGVLSTRVGYTGGDLENPTYRAICGGRTGRMFTPSRNSNTILSLLELTRDL